MGFLKKTFKKEEGYSLAMVLIALTTFIILSSSMLLMAVRSTQMGKVIRSSDNSYYDLEKVINETMIDLDLKLGEAENKSIRYMKSTKYNSENLDSTGGLNFKNPLTQKFFYDKWIDSVHNPSVRKDGKTNNDKYNDLIGKYSLEAFGRVYFNYLQEVLESFEGEKTVDLDGKNVKVNVSVISKKDYTGLTSSSLWQDFNPNEKDVDINITATSEEGKVLSALVRPTIPVYDVVKSMQSSIAVKGNPIWSNAISAGGEINFSNSITVSGDVYSENKNGGNGITVKDANLTISGNVYSHGDFSLKSDNKNSTIIIRKYGKIQQRIKENIFGNEQYFDSSLKDGLDISNYIEDKNLSFKNKKTFFIFNDSVGGNLYCNNLIMDKSAKENSAMIINGNVATKESIKNESIEGMTNINIEKNFIGITPCDIEKDILGSYIENNIYYPEKKKEIGIKGIVIVPGVKPIHLSYGEDILSYESMSTNFWTRPQFENLMNAYSVMPSSGISYKFNRIVNENGKLNIVEEVSTPRAVVNLRDFNVLKKSFIDYMKGVPSYYPDTDIKGVVSNLNTDIRMYNPDGVEGYCFGAAIIFKDAQGKVYFPENFKNYDANKKDYGSLKNLLKDIFEAKTSRFGTKDKEFSNLVDINAIENSNEDSCGIKLLVNSENVLEISGKQSGIIYSKGNLTIKGSGEFLGTIICEGNVSIKGKIKIVHDESVIKSKLEKYKITREFFNPGELGDYLLNTKVVSTDETVRENKNIKRYKIVKWKQNN